MKGLIKKKSKRVSWASGAKLCQVKLFLSEDCPSKVCLQAHDHLKAKTRTHCSNSVYSDNHPSRAEGRHSLDPLRRKFSHHCSRYEGRHLDPLRKKLSRIPQIEWKCPPKFVFKNYWQVANGEESGEASTQKHREKRVLEAIYPRLSDIPPNPSLPLDVQEDQVDDSQICLFPITPIEEEEMVDLSSDKAAPQNAYLDLQLPAVTQGLLSKNTNAPHCDPSASLKSSANEKPALKVLPGFQPDVVAASASAAADIAMTAIMKSKEQASLIDTDLLIKLLSNPNMIEKMMAEQGAPASAKTEHVSGSKPMTASVPLPSIKPGLVEDVINDDGAVMKVGSTSTSGANLVRALVAKPSPKPDPNMEKLIDEHGTAVPSSGSRPVTFSVALPSPKPGPVMEKTTHRHRTPTDTGAAPVSVPKSVTSQVAAPSQRPDPVVKISGNEHGVPCPKPGPLMENLIHKRRATTDSGSAPVSRLKSVTSRAVVLSTGPNPAVKISVNEHGVCQPQPGPPMENSNHTTHGACTPTYKAAAPVSGPKSLTFQLGIPCSRPGPVVKKPPNEYGVSIPKPSPVVERSTHKRAPIDTGASPVSGQKPVKSWLAVPSPKPDTVVKKSVYEHGMPADAGGVSSSARNLPTLLSSFPSLKPDRMKIKKMINEYGTPDDRKGNEPISRSLPLTPQLPILSPKLDFFSKINSHPVPNVGEAGLQSKAFLSDAGRPNLDTVPNVMQTDLQLREMSPDMEKLNLHPSLNVMQPSFSAMTTPVKDIDYIKNLIRQHGEMQERKECSLYQSGKFDVHSQDSKRVLVNPNELTPVFQRASAFFNSQNGYKSLFRHDRSEKLQPGSVPEERSAKRTKLKEIPGWT